MIAIKQDNVLSQITWIENDEDKIEYLEENYHLFLMMTNTSEIN